MNQNTLRNRTFSGIGGDPTLPGRVSILENNEYEVTYFTEINNSTGTITIPTGATILLDQFQGGIDAFVSTIQNGQPTGTMPKTGGGVNVDVSSFDALGNFTLTGTPSAYPVALIYVFKIKGSDWSNVDLDHVVDYYPTNVVRFTDVDTDVTLAANSDSKIPSQKAIKSYVDTGLSGKQNTLTNPVTGTGTDNEIAAFNSTGSTITSLSTATYPSLTELSYVKGVTSSIQTQTNTITSQYQEILQGGVLYPASLNTNVWISTQQNTSAGVGGASAVPPAMIHIVSTDYPAITGRTPKLRIRVILACNDAAPGANFTIGLYPVTRPATSGGSGVLAYTRGTVVTGSTVTINTPAADSLNTAVTADFGLPADGVYAMAVDPSTTTAANSSEHIQVSLQFHYV